MDLVVMCIMSEGLDVIQLLQQLESEGLDPRLNQVKSDLISQGTFRWTWMCQPDGLEWWGTRLLSDGLDRGAYIQKELSVWAYPGKKNQCTSVMPEDSSWCNYPQGIRRQWCQNDISGVTKEKWNKRTNNLK